MKIKKIQIRDSLNLKNEFFGKIYIGHVKNNKPHGKGYIKQGELDKFNNISWIGKTILKKGTFKDGYLEKGTVNEFLKIFDGTLKNKERTGKGKLRYIHKNGKSYQEYIGEVRLHKGYGYVPHGNGKLTHYNGGISLGKFVNGLLKKGKIKWGSNKKWELFPSKKVINYHRGNINKRLKKL